MTSTAAAAALAFDAIQGPPGFRLRLLREVPPVLDSGDYDTPSTGMLMQTTSVGYLDVVVPGSAFEVVSASNPTQWVNTAEIVFGPNVGDTFWDDVKALVIYAEGDSYLGLSNIVALTPVGTITVGPHEELVIAPGQLAFTVETAVEE